MSARLVFSVNHTPCPAEPAIVSARRTSPSAAPTSEAAPLTHSSESHMALDLPGQGSRRSRNVCRAAPTQSTRPGCDTHRLETRGRLSVIAPALHHRLLELSSKEEPAVGRSIIVEGRGAHFDPDIVDAFMSITEQFRDIALRHADGDEALATEAERLATAVGEPR